MLRRQIAELFGEDPKLCLLVVIGVPEDGTKELLAVEDGYCESTESWASVVRDLKARGANEPRLVTSHSSVDSLSSADAAGRSG